MNSIIWHDYETFGSNPRADRPCQFAAIRTDEDLNVIDEPVEFFCAPAPDFLPDPVACRVTGISPVQALEKGVCEADFCATIADQFLQPGTCVAGYNSIRFDDEVTRHMLYRCFRDPYEREWKNGNSRWDIIDLLRTTRALRPDGIQWPDKDDGKPSFRLEELTAANNIPHTGAHDALADVRATIAMAKLVKEKQPRLYDFLYNLRSKNRVLPMLDMHAHTPLVHVSGMFPALRGCLGIVIPLLKHPANSNGIIVVDLLSDPSPWLELSAEQIREKLYTPSSELAEGEERIALKTIHVNKCPVLAPMSVLTDEVCKRYQLDSSVIEQRRDQLLSRPELLVKLKQVFSEGEFTEETNPDLMLYCGGFFDDHDKRLMHMVHQLPPVELSTVQNKFHDNRLPELLFRYRARNYPDTLDAKEIAVWQEHCRGRLLGQSTGAGLSLSEFNTILLQEQTDMLPALYTELERYAEQLCTQLQIV